MDGGKEDMDWVQETMDGFSGPSVIRCLQKQRAAAPHGSARVIRCLQKQRDKLPPMCCATGKRRRPGPSMGSAARNPLAPVVPAPVITAASRARDKLPPMVLPEDYISSPSNPLPPDAEGPSCPHGSARVIRCLQKQRDKLPPMGRRVSAASISRDKIPPMLVLSSNPLPPEDRVKLPPICSARVFRCPPEAEGQASPHGSARVIRCLQKQRDKLPPMCWFCPSNPLPPEAEGQAAPHGSARVIRCLQKQRDKLSPMCRATFFDEEVRFSHNIDFQYPMKKACEREIDDFCAAVPHGDATVIRCLQDNQFVKDFSKACKEQVRQYEMGTNQPHALVMRGLQPGMEDFSKACKEQVRQYEMRGSTGLRSLSTRLKCARLTIETQCHCMIAKVSARGEVCDSTVPQCLTKKMG
eukprot:gene14060-20001_t